MVREVRREDRSFGRLRFRAIGSRHRDDDQNVRTVGNAALFRPIRCTETGDIIAVKLPKIGVSEVEAT